MLPLQLIQSLQNVNGFNQQAFEAAHHLPQVITSIRLNPDKAAAFSALGIGIDEVETKNVPWCQHGIYLPQRPYFTFDPTFHAGAYYVQEASSMFLWQIMQQIVADDTQKAVLDLCAAPGGKSTLLASYFKEGLIVSNEVIKQRAAILVENITKWGSSNVVITNNDPMHFKSLPNFFDVIVIDAPCSGSGLFRKDRNAISEWSEDNVNLCSQRQKRIIADIIDSLNENGLLAYSTCSYSKAENEDILDWIVETYHLKSIPIALQPEWGIVTVNSDKHNAFGYRFYPDQVKGEGFFISVFKKENTTVASKKVKETKLPNATKQEVAVIDNFITIPSSFYLFKQNEFVRIFPAKWQQQLQQIAGNLYIKKAGIELGVIKGKDLIPAHELAMSHLNLSQIKKNNLNKYQALQYLSKKEVNIDTNVNGWVLAMYNKITLGWMKVLPNRINNYYPTEWRILKTNF